MTQSMLPSGLFAHAAAALMMQGLIWIMQIVRSPMFTAVPADPFMQSEQRDVRLATSSIVAPLMLCELVLALMLLNRAFVPPTAGG